jgi:hypothetical protein
MECTILIFNYESISFLRVCIHQIRKHRNPLIVQHIIISEQSGDAGYMQVIAEFGDDPDIVIVPMKKICSGYAIDYVLRYMRIETEFFCTLDVDSFPIHVNWLLTSIQLLQETDMSFVGLRSPIDGWYRENQGRTQPFFIMGPCYCVGRTAHYTDLSLKMGYTKHEDRPKINGLFGFSHDTWGAGYSDDGVAASWYEDTQGERRKLSYGITGRMGLTTREGEYGRVIGDLVIHICFSYTSLLHGDKRLEAMGKDYLALYEKIENETPEEVMKYILRNIEYSNKLAPMEYWDKWAVSPVPDNILKTLIELA